MEEMKEVVVVRRGRDWREDEDEGSEAEETKERETHAIVTLSLSLSLALDVDEKETKMEGLSSNVYFGGHVTGSVSTHEMKS